MTQAPLCHSCARYIGSTRDCPYCGATTRRDRHRVLLRCLASLLSIGGIVLLLAL